MTHHFTHLVFVSTVMVAAAVAGRRKERSRLLLLLLIPSMNETALVIGVAASSVLATVWLTVLATLEVRRTSSSPPEPDEQMVPQSDQ